MRKLALAAAIAATAGLVYAARLDGSAVRDYLAALGSAGAPEDQCPTADLVEAEWAVLELGDSDGTVVRRHPPRQPGTVVGVASERDVIVITMDGGPDGLALHAADGTPPPAARRPGPVGPGDLLALLDEHRVAGKQLHIAGDHLTLVVSRENLHAETRVREALADRFGAAVSIADTWGAVSVVGTGINASFENVRRGTAALIGSGATIEGVATSSFRITWMIDRARLDDAVRLLHRAFLDTASPLAPSP